MALRALHVVDGENQARLAGSPKAPRVLGAVVAAAAAHPPAMVDAAVALQDLAAAAAPAVRAALGKQVLAGVLEALIGLPPHEVCARRALGDAVVALLTKSPANKAVFKDLPRLPGILGDIAAQLPVSGDFLVQALSVEILFRGLVLRKGAKAAVEKRLPIPAFWERFGQIRAAHFRKDTRAALNELNRSVAASTVSSFVVGDLAHGPPGEEAPVALRPDATLFADFGSHALVLAWDARPAETAEPHAFDDTLVVPYEALAHFQVSKQAACVRLKLNAGHSIGELSPEDLQIVLSFEDSAIAAIKALAPTVLGDAMVLAGGAPDARAPDPRGSTEKCSKATMRNMRPLKVTPAPSVADNVPVPPPLVAPVPAGAAAVAEAAPAAVVVPPVSDGGDSRSELSAKRGAEDLDGGPALDASRRRLLQALDRHAVAGAPVVHKKKRKAPPEEEGDVDVDVDEDEDEDVQMALGALGDDVGDADDDDGGFLQPGEMSFLQSSLTKIMMRRSSAAKDRVTKKVRTLVNRGLAELEAAHSKHVEASEAVVAKASADEAATEKKIKAQLRHIEAAYDTFAGKVRGHQTEMDHLTKTFGARRTQAKQDLARSLVEHKAALDKIKAGVVGEVDATLQRVSKQQRTQGNKVKEFTKMLAKAFV